MNVNQWLFCLFALCAVGAASPEGFGQAAVPLEPAVERGDVEATVRGLGGSTGDAILLTIRRKVPQVLRLTLTPGIVFQSVSGDVQNMVAASIKGERVGEQSYRPANEILLADDSRRTYVIEAYCLDFHKPDPRPSDSFTIAPVDERARSIVQEGKNQSASIGAIQSALWLDRENVSPAQLKRRFPVTDADIAVAHAIMRSQGKRPLGSLQAPISPEADQISAAKADDELWAWLDRNGMFADVWVRKEVLVGDPLKIPKVIARLTKRIEEKELLDRFGAPIEKQAATHGSASFFLQASRGTLPGEKVYRFGNIALLIDGDRIVQAAKFEGSQIPQGNASKTQERTEIDETVGEPTRPPGAGTGDGRGSQEEPLRTWIDRRGKYRVEAEFLELDNGNVRLRREDGKVISMPLERLSQADQEFVESHVAVCLESVSSYYVDSILRGRPLAGVPLLLKLNDAQIVIVRAELILSRRQKRLSLDDFHLSDASGEKGIRWGVSGKGEDAHLQTFGQPPLFYDSSLILYPGPGPVLIVLAYSIKSGAKLPLILTFKGTRREVELLSDVEWRIRCLQSRSQAVRIAAAKTLGKNWEDTTMISAALENALKTEQNAETRDAISEALQGMKPNR